MKRRRVSLLRKGEGFGVQAFCEQGGFTTIGAACAILVTCALIFGCLWVARSESQAAGVQAVADAAALAAENEVAEFAIAVRVADATLLTLSLTGLSLMGAGSVCCCFPPSAAVGTRLIDAGKAILQKRDSVAKAEHKALNAAQDALSATAQMQAQVVIQENAQELGGTAIGYVELVPEDGPEVIVGSYGESDEAVAAVDEHAEELQEAATRAEEESQRAADALKEAWLHDCGAMPDYCMAQRAQTLAGMTGAENPVASSINTWSFAMALHRAQAYYRNRLAHEAPATGGVEECARSALRTRFYAYAVKELSKGYANEPATGVPQINMPLLPRNTAEMKQTELYTEAAYPIAGGMLHAWPGCPEATGAQGNGSLSQLEAGAYKRCPTCGLDAAALGSVAAASTSIENGFEYHYRIVASCAREYCAAKAAAEPAAEEAKQTLGSILDALKEAFDEAVACRVEAHPPGRFGALAAISYTAQGQQGATPFFSGQDPGSFAAVSAAVLAEDESEDVLSSLLDGVAQEIGSPLTDAGEAVLGLWSALLNAYKTGVEGLRSGVKKLLDGIPLVGASGLGTWAAEELSSMLEGVGLQPANTGAVKPVVSNTEIVAAKGEGPVAQAVKAAKGAP